MILTLAVSQIDFTLNDHKNDSFQCQTKLAAHLQTHTHTCVDFVLILGAINIMLDIHSTLFLILDH